MSGHEDSLDDPGPFDHTMTMVIHVSSQSESRIAPDVSERQYMGLKTP